MPKCIDAVAAVVAAVLFTTSDFHFGYHDNDDVNAHNACVNITIIFNS